MIYCIYHWITLLYTRTNSIINQLYVNKKIKKNKQIKIQYQKVLALFIINNLENTEKHKRENKLSPNMTTQKYFLFCHLLVFCLRDRHSSLQMIKTNYN